MPVTFLRNKRHLLTRPVVFKDKGDKTMKKSTMFISTALTVFMLAVMAGAVSAYQQVVKNNDVAPQATAEPVVQQAATVETVPSPPTVVSPEQATSVAVAFMGDSNVYGVEVVDYEGVPAFLVTFSSGKLVYVSPTGEILAISEVKPVVVVAPSTNNNGGNSNTANNGGGGEHEDHDDDDDHDDDHDD
jgi:hypothetical protein